MSSTVGEAYIDVSADASGLAADVKAAADRAARAAKATVELDASVDKAKVKAAAQEAARAAKAQIRYDAKVETARVAAEAKIAADAASRQAVVTFTPESDFAPLIAEAKAAAAAAKSRVTFEAHMESRGFTRDSEGVFRNLTGEALTAERAVSELGQAMASAGGGGGGFLSTALDSVAGAAGRGGAQIAIVVAAVETLLPYAVAAGAGIIALAGQLAYASAQAIPLATNLGAVGLAAATTVIATRGLGDAFKAYGKQQEAANASNVKTKEGQAALKKATDEYQASLKNLAPAAADFVESIGSLGGEFRNLRREVQGNFFAGLGDQIKDTARNLLPALQSGLGDTARLLNSGATALVKWAGSKAGIQTISNILGGLNGILGSLVDAAGSFGSGIVTIFEGALPAGQGLADAIARIGENFSTWASGFVQSGGLSGLLDKAATAGGQLWAILKNVGSILGSLFSGSGDLGSGLLQTIQDVTGGFADMLKTPEGQAQMSEFFTKMGEDLHGLADGLRVGIPAFVTLVQQLQNGADGFNRLLGALEPIAQPLGVVIGLLTSAGGIAGIGVLLSGVIAPFQLLAGLDWGGIVSGITGFFTSLGGAGGGFDIGGLVGGIVSSVSGLAQQIWAGAGDLAAGFAAWVAGIPGIVSGWVASFLGYFAGLATQVWAAAGDIAAGAAAWLAGLPAAAIIGISNFLVGFIDLAGRAVTAAGDIVGAFTNWLAGLPAAAVYGLATLTGTFIGLGMRLFAAAGDAAAAFTAWVAGLPGAALTLAAQIGASLAGLAGRMFSAAGSAAGSFASWVAGIPGAAASLAGRIASSLAGLAGRMFAAAGSAISAFTSWVSGLPGAARSAAANVVNGFSGLAGKAISAAGDIVARARAWLSGLAAAGRTAANNLVSAFRGLAGKIVNAIGTIIPRVQMPSISGIIGRIRSAVQDAATPNARGSVVTSPTFALIGEAGPEMVVPLRRGAPMDPDVVNVLKSLATERGYGDDNSTRRTGTPTIRDINVMLPTGDPEAAAMAVLNRVVLAA